MRGRAASSPLMITSATACSPPHWPALDPNNPASLIAHWAAAVKTLQTVHRAYRKWIAKTEISGSPEAQAFNGLDETARDALDQIDKFEIALLNKRPPVLSRASRWQNAVDELRELLDVYTQWLDNLPGSIRQSGSALVDKLEAMAEFDGAISELEGADPPLGWGRD